MPDEKIFNPCKFSPLIMIAGGTGVGTSTLAKNLVPIIGAHCVIGTDTIRQILRGMTKEYSEKEMKILKASTYDIAYEPRDGIYSADDLSKDEKARIEKGYESQEKLLSGPIKHAAFRALSEGIPTIIEGVHLNPNSLRKKDENEPDGLRDYYTRIFYCVLYISKNEPYQKRICGGDSLRSYQERSDPLKYKRYFPAIKTISSYIKSFSNKAHLVIDTNQPEQVVVDIFCAHYFNWRKAMLNLKPPFML